MITHSEKSQVETLAPVSSRSLAFLDDGTGFDSLLSELAASTGAKTDVPFTLTLDQSQGRSSTGVILRGGTEGLDWLGSL